MVRELRRIGKRVVIGMSNDLWVVIHLMIAGRLHWRAPGVLSSTLDEFRAALTAENRTLKRALTDPRIVSGIGNAYSDEILPPRPIALLPSASVWGQTAHEA